MLYFEQTELKLVLLPTLKHFELFLVELPLQQSDFLFIGLSFGSILLI
jgi:hypothetical protein